MPAPGDRLADRYRILALLGAGGMATVHRALDERLDREVAIKVLLPNLAGDEGIARRFEREARAMAAMAHPGLVAVFDVDAGDPSAGREPFVVMELCPGGSLADRMGPGRPMPPDELVPILVAIADALGALHHAGLVHRDVKPSNILFAVDRVKLADFGLVRSESGGVDAAELTDPGTAIGTLGYLAPERLRGEPGGSPADVFALATIAHLGLTGALPRPSGSVRDVVAAAPFRAPSVSSVAPPLGPAFDAIVSDGLGIDPARRPDAVTFGSRLAAALGSWTRGGRPGAAVVASAGLLAEAPMMATAATGPRGPGQGADADDPTTAIALPVEATAPVELPAPERPGPPPVAESVRRPGPRRMASPAALLLAALAVVALAVVAAGLGSMLTPVEPGSGPASATPVAGASASVAPSAIRPTTPPPSADPAIAALDVLDAAIDGARGGRDGLKGKEANDLASRAARVRSALDAGDRSRALSEARDLDRRVGEVTDRLEGDAIDRLRAASAALVRALGG